MQLIEKSISISLPFSPEDYGIRREDAVFFDIETTGLSAYKSGLYLIGALVYEDKEWHLLQYFAESAADEVPMLTAFFSLLRRKKQLVSFNGEGFDIPFLTAMVRQYALPYSFDGIESCDIFKLLAPGKRLLRLPSYRLKACEEFLGIHREDRYSGGELISVYRSYLTDHDPEKRYLLLLHNEEDLLNLPLVLPILSYAFLPSAALPLLSVKSTPLPTGDTLCLDLHYHSPLSFPVPVDLSQEDFRLPGTKKKDTSSLRGKDPAESPVFFLHLEGQSVQLSLRLYDGSLRYFYPNYKDYYYLPAEDRAIHKSIAEFVDKSHKKKATAKTAYTQKQGQYLPDFDGLFPPLFSGDYASKIHYTEYNDGLFSDPDKAAQYLRSFLKLL